jgi:HEAT repeat protein
VFLRLFLAAFVALAPAHAAPSAAQDGGPAPTTATELEAAIDRLGDLEYESRSRASRTIRRAPAAQAVPALLEAVAGHRDGYVRFRALVLLAGFNDPRAEGAMDQALADPNDRLREVGYAYFEQHPDKSRAPRLLAALDKELSEFVRPRLVRALAAHADLLPAIQDRLKAEALRGEDFFRGAVIEALGEYKAAYALAELTRVANLEGPLQDDAALAIGKVGDKRTLPTLAGLQRSAPAESQPAIAASICMLGVNCGAHLGYLGDTLRFADKNPGFQDLLRGTAGSLGAVGTVTETDAPLQTLLDVGIPSQDPARAPIALAFATAAIRSPAFVFGYFTRLSDRDGAVDLLRDGFDMLEEDYGEEQFFMTVRRQYWAAPEGSTVRQAGELLIRRLEF